MTSTSRVLVLTTDTVGPTMAGRGIRSFELARALAARCTVTLASRQPVEAAPGGVATATFVGRDDLQTLVAAHDVVVGISGLLAEHPWLASTGTIVVADAYDPVLLEVLEWFAAAPVAERDA